MLPGATITTAVLILFPLTLHLAAATGTNFQYSARSCKNVGTSTDTTYASNVDSLFSSLSDSLSTSSSGFAKATAGSSPSTAYGLALCRGDVSTDTCTACISLAASNLRGNCSDAKEGIVWEENCMLRYANRNIFSSVEISPNFTSINPMNTITGADSEKVLTSTLNNVTDRAASASGGKKIATQEAALAGANQVIYSLAQCTPDLTAYDCSLCFVVAISDLLELNHAGIVLMPSCNLRYDLYPFYDNANVPSGLSPATMPTPAPALAPVLAPTTKSTTTTSPTPTQGPSVPTGKRRPSSVVEIVGIITGAAILLILGIGIWCYKLNRNSVSRYEDIGKPKIGAAIMEETSTVEAFPIDFKEVCDATKDFHHTKKLGRGGFGDVFEGELDGEKVAVKRFTNSNSNSGQGAAESKNEVDLLAKLKHHPNLVKLRRFCLTDKEKILVYEYLPNSSLDKLLFDPEKRASLDWQKRFNIICGIANGLLYLHRECKPPIVHRDLKPSNILLDADMNPKVSDFGISTMLGDDQTRANTTKVAGTDAYMAPEYDENGEYSPETDMYSFGIIVLEIVTGQRNRYCGRRLQKEDDLKPKAQRLWAENKPLDMVDSTLEKNYSEDEVVKCIDIGLKCIQHEAKKRPTVQEVLTALNETKNKDLPQDDCGRTPNFSGTSDTAATGISPDQV